jgi:hypothetical protein
MTLQCRDQPQMAQTQRQTLLSSNLTMSVLDCPILSVTFFKIFQEPQNTPIILSTITENMLLKINIVKRLWHKTLNYKSSVFANFS